MVWKEIEQDGAPDSDRLVLIANTFEFHGVPDVDYRIAFYRDGYWQAIDTDTALPPDYWADFDRLPLSVSQPRLGDDNYLAIAGMKFPLGEVCPTPEAPQMIIPVSIGGHEFPVDFGNPTAEVAHHLAALITEQGDGVEVVGNQIVVQGGVATFAIAPKETDGNS